jgi:SNF2 family DNA or RNA helicase
MDYVTILYWSFCGKSGNRSSNRISHATEELLQLINSDILNKNLQPIVLRMDGAVLRESLPKKYEIVIHSRLSPLQQSLYKDYIKAAEETKTKEVIGVLQGFSTASLDVFNLNRFLGLDWYPSNSIQA